jgi:hypothetical protein
MHWRLAESDQPAEPGDRFVSRFQQYPKSQALSLVGATPPHKRTVKHGRPFNAAQGRREPSSLERDSQRPLRAASPWRDFLIAAFWGAVIIGTLTYFFGWFMAITAIAVVIVALALCLNFAINHTIDL